MSYAKPDPGETHQSDPAARAPQLPAWLRVPRAGAPGTLEEIAFLSGAALSHLHLRLASDALPRALLRDRLALSAAEASLVFSGRRERVGALRDAMCFLRPGDLPGPAGDIALAWHHAAARPLSVKTLQRALASVDPSVAPDQIKAWLLGGQRLGQGAPVSRCAEVLEIVLEQAPRAETMALILAEAALARALGWDHLVPLLATGLKRADLRKCGAELRRACHHALVVSVIEALQRADVLAQRTGLPPSSGPNRRRRHSPCS